MERRIADVTPTGLAAAVNLSPSRFTHLFSSEVGLSPARYLHALRMERARLLLERTFLSVKEVMTQVGIADASHFSRDFKRYHGMPPREVRRVPVDGRSPFLARHFAFIEVAVASPLAGPAGATNNHDGDER